MKRQPCKYCEQIEMNAPICGAQITTQLAGIMTCTRAPFHSGQHVACGIEHEMVRWENERTPLRWGLVFMIGFTLLMAGALVASWITQAVGGVLMVGSAVMWGFRDPLSNREDTW